MENSNQAKRIPSYASLLNESIAMLKILTSPSTEISEASRAVYLDRLKELESITTTEIIDKIVCDAQSFRSAMGKVS